MATKFISNGLNGVTGNYLITPATVKQIAQIARGKTLTPEHLLDLEMKQEQGLSEKGLTRGKDPTKLEEAGWAVIFAETYPNEVDTGLTAEAIKEALSPLLERRQAQASQQNEQYYREFISKKGDDRAYRPGDTKHDFLYDNDIASSIGVADPHQLPYYLLLVGDPATIPFSFQYELDVEYAVGRLYFDSLEKYRRYADTVVAVETGQHPSTRRAIFFGVRNQDDDATRTSADYLIPDLVSHLTDTPAWNIETILETDATKAKLKTLLGGADTPDFIFTASHGIAFPQDHELHYKHLGALVCQDWPGPLTWGEKQIPSQFYFAADDVSNDAQVQGLIAFHFACYGAGMPTTDNFYRQTDSTIPAITADQEFIAQLPQRLLSHPNGTALAVIGHIDRTWTRSFQSAEELPRLPVFQNTLSSILDGEPVGLAMEAFNQRYGVCATDLHRLLDTQHDEEEDEEYDEALASTWLDTNDARNYIILGDPAVKIGARSAPGDAASTNASGQASLSAPTATSELEATVIQLTERVSSLEQKVEALETENRYLTQQIRELQQGI